MTPKQSQQFNALCEGMAALLTEVRRKQPNATLFIEDGSVSIYDWPSDEEERPDKSLTDSHYWPGASGGGAGA